MTAILAGGGVAVGAEAGQLLDDPQLFDIPGNGGLGGLVARLLQRLQKLLLGFDILGGDDLHDFCLSLGFHFLHLFQS